MPGLGENLRTARERSGLTIEELARETRISARFLRAIEAEDFGVLPGGLFNRGFIRTYASKLGIDPELAVHDYESVTEGGAIASTEGSPVPASEPETRRLPVGPIALAGLIVLFVMVWAFQRGVEPQEEAVLESRPEAPQSDSAAAPSVVPLRVTPAAAPERVPSTGARTPAPDANPSVPRPAAPEPEGEEGGVNVEILVHEETWIWAEADGQILTGEWGLTLGPGRSQSFTAEHALELKIGNAGGVTLTVNGREIRDVGNSNQVRTLTITPENADTLAGS